MACVFGTGVPKTTGPSALPIHRRSRGIDHEPPTRRNRSPGAQGCTSLGHDSYEGLIDMTLANKAEALFVSSLQPSDRPSVARIAAANRASLSQHRGRLRLRRCLRRRIRRASRHRPRPHALGTGHRHASHGNRNSRGLITTSPHTEPPRGTRSSAMKQIQIKKRPVKDNEPVDLRTPSGKPLPH
jgi:hypothetical protein